jgi:PAS domain S-box-containing protein
MTKVTAEILKNGLDAAFLTRPDGTILYANPAACALFGYTLNEFEALGRRAVIDDSDPRVVEALARRREAGFFQGVLTMSRKDGGRFSALLSSALFTNIDGEQRTSMFVRDITEQEEREKVLRTANSELTRALAEVQQLRDILPICSYCKRIRNDEQYWEQVDAYLSTHAQMRFTHGICPECYEKHVRTNADGRNYS